MSSKSIMRSADIFPSRFDEFFRPWNEWFGNGGNTWANASNVPAVNISETKDSYEVSLAAPGMKKEDFKVEIDGNIMTISSEKNETKEENDKKFIRKEYNYSSFSQSFTVPEEINLEKVEAKYTDGILRLSLPRKENAKLVSSKSIAVK